jgi:hypothetical protein
MARCPICRSELAEPPEDVRDWFRCDQCGTPLQVPSSVAKIVFAITIGVFFIATGWLFAYFSGQNFGLVNHFLFYLIAGSFLTFEAAIARIFWKTRLAQPRPCDPYSSLNLSDDRKRMRGYRPLP